MARKTTSKPRGASKGRKQGFKPPMKGDKTEQQEALEQLGNPYDALLSMLRPYRKKMLVDALAGSATQRLQYCVWRAVSRYQADLTIYGSCTMDVEAQSRMIIWWFRRLERIAKQIKDKADG